MSLNLLTIKGIFMQDNQNPLKCNTCGSKANIGDFLHFFLLQLSVSLCLFSLMDLMTSNIIDC